MNIMNIFYIIIKYNILYKSNKKVCIELYQDWLYKKIVKNEVFLKMN